MSNLEYMTKEEKIIREYFESIEDINGDETIKILPLTLIDMLLEYEVLVKNFSLGNVVNCPGCQSSDIFSFKLTHYKCRKCNTRYTD